MEKSRLLLVHSGALVRHSNRLRPFSRECQNPGQNSTHPSLRSGCLASLGWLVVNILCQPERTRVTPYRGHDHVRVSLATNPGRKNTFRPERKNRKLRTGRQSGLGRGHTPIGCVSVRPLCPLPLGSGLIVVRPRSFVPSQWVVELHPVVIQLWLPNPARSRQKLS